MDATSPQQPFANFPVELYLSILVEAAERGQQALSLQLNQALPKNGQPRLNKLLASLLTLEREAPQYLECVTWKRLGIFSTDFITTVMEYRINDCTWCTTRDLRNRMDALYQQFEEKKRHIKSLELVLTAKLEIKQLLLPYAIKMFENVPPDQIEEVSVHFVDENTWSGREDDERRVAILINTLLAPIPTFQNLLSIHITSVPRDWRLPYDLLAATFRALPIVQSIGLYSESVGYTIPAMWRLDVDYLPGHDRLGLALASRPCLKTLTLYHLTGPSKEWLEMQWLGPIEELTVSARPHRLESCNITNGQPYINFLYLFHRTLVSLHLTQLIFFPVLSPQDEYKTRQFKSLKHLTIGGMSRKEYGGRTCPFTSVLFFALLPSVESLYLIDRYTKFFSWRSEKILKAQRGPYWPSLKEVFQSKMNLDFQTTKGRHNIQHAQRMKEHCEKHSVKYSTASLQHFLPGEESIRRRSIYYMTGAQQQVFCYPDPGFRSRLGLDRHESDRRTESEMIDLAQSTSEMRVYDVEPPSSVYLSDSSYESSSSSEDEDEVEDRWV